MHLRNETHTKSSLLTGRLKRISTDRLYKYSGCDQQKTWYAL